MSSSEEDGEVKFFRRIETHKKKVNYEIKQKIGEGTFGEVYLGFYKNREYALKKMIYVNERNGIPLTTLREIRILKKLRHDNIIELIDVKRDGLALFVVFEYMKYDLYKMIEKKRFSLDEIKKITSQILKGVSYLHELGIMHRDMKSSNILLDDELNVKIADFGLSRYEYDGKYTPGLVTLWYRPPEMLFGGSEYTEKIDIWGVGCILGELLLGGPIFKGKTELNQLEKIIQLCGTINERTLPGISTHPDFSKYNLPQAPNRIKYRFMEYDSSAVDLLLKLLHINPIERISAKDAIKNQFLTIVKPPKRKIDTYPTNKRIL